MSDEMTTREEWSGDEETQQPDLHAILSERSASFNQAEHRIRELEEQLEAAERDRDQAVAAMREIQRRYVRTDKA